MLERIFGRGEKPQPELPQLPPDAFVRTEVLTKVLTKVLNGLHAEAQGDFYHLIPPEYKVYVDALISKHHPTYKDRFPNQEDFAQAMARNWVAKQRVFPALAEQVGFVPADPVTDTAETYNRAVIAGLTSSSSYIFLGEGAFDDHTGKGASLEYARLPLREGEDLENISLTHGATFLDVPKVANRLYVRYNSGNGDLTFQTSPLVTFYKGVDLPDPERAMQQFKGTFKIASDTINLGSGFIKRV